MSARPDYVDFHFDVMCPYAYQTSRLIREVRDQTGLQVNWRFFSLEEINRVEGKKHPWEREWSYGWSMMRIGALLRSRSMADVDAWYERSARALHVEGRKPHEKAVARHLLEELGFDAALVDEAIADPTTNGWSVPPVTECRRCFSRMASVYSGPCWWIHQPGRRRCDSGTRWWP